MSTASDPFCWGELIVVPTFGKRLQSDFASHRCINLNQTTLNLSKSVILRKLCSAHDKRAHKKQVPTIQASIKCPLADRFLSIGLIPEGQLSLCILTFAQPLTSSVGLNYDIICCTETCL